MARAFIGRSTELRDLRTALVAASESRRGSLWILSGEAGVGKSRLAEAFEQAALEEGFVCSWGRCWEGGMAPAYWPWRQVFSSLEPESSTPAPLSDAPSSDASSRFELFDRAGRWLAGIAASRPLWICLEDLHAADVASLELLEAIAPRLRAMPVVVVATTRAGAFASDTATAFHRLARSGRQMSIGPMDEADARALLRSFAPSDAQIDALADQAVEVTAGHPLFLVEMGRLLAASPDAMGLPQLLPASLEAALHAHLEALAPEHRDWLSRAAVVGVEFEAAVIEGAFQREGSSKLPSKAWDSAARIGLLANLGGGKWRFFHALLRDLLLSRIDVATKQLWHARVARWLEETGQGSPAQLAHHLLEAGAPHGDQAIEAALTAASASLRGFALDDARKLLERVAPDVERSKSPTLVARLETLRGLADIGEGAHEQGRRRCLEAAEVARRANDWTLAGRALLAAGSHLQFGRVDERLVGALEAAVAGLDGEPDSPLRVRLLARLAAAAQPAADPSGPIGLARDAIAMAERIGEDRLRIDTLRTAASALVDLVPAAERRPIDDRHLELAMRLGSEGDALTAHIRLVNDCFELGDLEAVERHIEEARRLALASPARRKAWLSPALLSTRRLWTGRLDDTLELIETAVAMGDALGDRNARGCYAFQRLRFIELDGAEPGLAHEAIEQVGRTILGSPTGEALGNVYAAHACFQLGLTEAGRKRVTPGEVRAALAFGDRTALMGIARWASETGDQVIARDLLQRHAATPDLMLSDGVLGLCFRSSMSMISSLAHRTVGDLAPALACAERAVGLARQHGGWPAMAEAHAEAARVARLLGQRAVAEDHETRGREIVAERELPGLRWRFDRLAEDGVDATVVSVASAASVASTAVESTEPEFVDEGDVWCVRWRNSEIRLKHTKGLKVVARLVAEPGREFHVLDLAEAAIEAGDPAARDGGEILDAQARESYRARATDLRDALAEAESNNDFARHAELSRELEFLMDELSRATGLGGRERRNAGAEERARQAVRKQVRAALNRISDLEAELGKHLAHRLRTGRYCVYEA